MLKQFLTDYFSYSVKERRAVIFLVLIILLLILVPAFFPAFIGSVSNSPLVDSVRTEVTRLENRGEANEGNSMLNPDYVEEAEENKALQPLPKKAINIMPVEVPVKADIRSIDINIASLDDLLNIPELDERIAKRVIAFRDKLGGFYSVEQLKETYGLDTMVFANIHDRLKIGEGVFRKININTASFDELKSHPYIRYQLANAIVEEREKNGDFQSVEAIQKIQLVTPEIYSKLAAYLKTH